MNRKTQYITFVSVLAFIMVVGIAAVYAQNGGGGRGNGGQGNPNRGQGSGTPQADMQNSNGGNSGNGMMNSDTQMNAFRNGGMGFVNNADGQEWNGQQRGNMGRGTGNNGVGFYSSLPPASDVPLSQEAIDALALGLLDEHHAYAVYEDVINQFGEVAPFVSIQQAEAQHIAALEFVYDRYGLTLPEIPAHEPLVFNSVAEACAAGAAAEIANFGIYDDMMAAVESYPDITQVVLGLRNASEFNHLPAFEACAN